MNRVSRAPLLVFSVVLLAAADPPWISKPGAQWTDEEAKQVLAASPWVKSVMAGIARPKTEDELRAGGEMGEHHGVGYDGVENNKPRNAELPKSLGAMLVGGKGAAVTNSRFVPGMTKVKIRWESALPVRIAELKNQEI